MAPMLWEDLERLSDAMETAPPDHVIAGIDDNFFVTQMPVKLKVKESEELQTLTGRTLFVSLSLLKRLPHREADAVLLHELAHFSGNDTLYTQKISPLLSRYGHYLQGLYEGGLSLPVFYYAVMFRALYELSLGSLSRKREFRADRLASEQTSPESMAHALLRITAYSQYRNELEQEIFDAEQAHEEINLSERIEGGFANFASAFVDKRDVGELATVHPFDTHPPLQQRLEELVEKFFPAIQRMAAKDRLVHFDYEKITYEDWDQPLYFREVESMSVENDWGARLDIVIR
ncbi:unnamed protein product, partial [Symbiodinium sp. CCMP2456]